MKPEKTFLYLFSCKKNVEPKQQFIISSSSDQFTIDVTTLGIIPGDNSDDSQAIQDLINMSVSGTILYFPAGVYDITNIPVTIRTANIDMEGVVGSGSNGTSFKFKSPDSWYAEYGQGVGMLNIAANYVDITGITFNQNYSASGHVDGEEPRVAGIILGQYPDVINKSIISVAGTMTDISISNCGIKDYYGDVCNNSIIKRPIN